MPFQCTINSVQNVNSHPLAAVSLGLGFCHICYYDHKFHQDADARPNNPQIKLIVIHLANQARNPQHPHQSSFIKYV
jgi:hypothetical protein